MRTGGPTAGRTDMKNLIVAVRNFVNAPKNGRKLFNFDSK